MNNIEMALKKIKNQTSFDMFDNIYAFTTENIAGYINKFSLKDKSLLTVGSSSDQVLNAFFLGCQDITLLDINPYTKDFFYLKKACIETLNYQEFFRFLCLFSNEQALDKDIFYKISESISDLNARKFWKTIMKKTSKEEIKYYLFSHDRQKVDVIKKSNNYLKDEASYQMVKEKIKYLNPNIIHGDIFHYHINRNYDNIFLSNISSYVTLDYLFEKANKLKDSLQEDGQFQIAYLYNIHDQNFIRKKYYEVYDLEKTMRLFHDSRLEVIPGMLSKIQLNENIEDAILVYKKKL